MITTGNVKGTFMEMDDDDSGVISLKELDEPLYMKILNFRKLCIEKKGSLLEAWILHFDLKQSGRVELPDWKKKCEELGYTESAEEIFRLFLLEDRNFMNADDFDSKVAAAVRLDDYRALLDPKYFHYFVYIWIFISFLCMNLFLMHHYDYILRH